MKWGYQSHHQGNQYHIRIGVTTPSKELVVSREHCDKKAHEDIYIAIRDAFNVATIQIAVGDEIRYVAQKDDLGPQASIVYP